MRHSRSRSQSQSRSHSHSCEDRHQGSGAPFRSDKLTVDDHIPEAYENILMEDSHLKKIVVRIPVENIDNREYNWRGEPTQLLCRRQEFEKFQNSNNRIKKPERLVNSPQTDYGSISKSSQSLPSTGERPSTSKTESKTKIKCLQTPNIPHRSRRSRSPSPRNYSSSLHATTTCNDRRQSNQKRERSKDCHDYKNRLPQDLKETDRRERIRPSSREITHSSTRQDGGHPRKRSRDESDGNVNTLEIQSNAARPQNQWNAPEGVVYRSMNIQPQGVAILVGPTGFQFPVDYVYPMIRSMRPHPLPYRHPRGPPGSYGPPEW